MNTDTHSYRDKGRAVFLAAIMVSSMVAGVAVLGVAPAAAQNIDDRSVSDAVAFESTGANIGPSAFSPNQGDTLIEFSITADDGSSLDLGTDSPFSSNIDNVTLLNASGDVIESSSSSGGGNSLSGELSSLNFADLSAASATSQVLLGNTTTSVGPDLELPSGDTLSEIQIFSNDGTVVNSSIAEVSNNVQQTIEVDDGSTGDSAAADAGGLVAVEITGSSTGGGDQAFTINGSSSFQRATGTGSDVFVLDTSANAVEGEDSIRIENNPGAGTSFDTTVTLNQLNLNVDDVGGDDDEIEVNDNDQLASDLEVSGSADLVNRDVEISISADGTEQTSQTVQVDGNGDFSATFSSGTGTFEAGDSGTVTVEDVNTGSTVEQSVDFVEQAETDAAANIETGTITENVGDFAFVDVSVEDTDSARLNVSAGGFTVQQPFNFDDASGTGGSVTIGMNLAAIGDDTQQEDDFFFLGDTDAAFDGDSITEGEPDSGNLPAETYRVELTADPGGDEATDRTQLNLIDQEFNALSSHIAPVDGDTPTDGIDSFLDAQTPGDTVAVSSPGDAGATGDQLVLLGDAGGFYGLDDPAAGDIDTELANAFNFSAGNISQDGTVQDGFDIGGTAPGHGLAVIAEGGSISGTEQVNLSSVLGSDAVTLGDFEEFEEFEQGFGSTNQFFVSIDTAQLAANLDLEDGDTVEFRHVVDVSEYPYLSTNNFDDDVITTFSQEVTVEETTIELDDVNDDDVYTVTDGENVTVSGTTNLAPGTEVTVSVSAEGEFESQTVEVTENPGFEATFDLTGFSDETLQNIEVSAPDSGGVETEIDAELGDTAEQNIEVADQEQIAELEETIANLEDQLSSLQDERDAIAEERDTIAEERDSLQDQLEQADSEISDLQSQNEDLQAQLEDAESTISDLQSQNEDLNSTVSDLESQVADLEGQLEEAQTQNESGDSDGGGPGFGVAAALVALIGAALLAVRRRD